MAAKSSSLANLENRWSRRQFPLGTVPLQDWQIMEKLDWEGLRDQGLLNFSGQLPDSLRQDRILGWTSIILAPYRYRTLSSYIQHGEILDDGSHLWQIDPSGGFKILAIRRDCELKHYSRWSNSAEAAKERTAGT